MSAHRTRDHVQHIPGSPLELDGKSKGRVPAVWSWGATTSGHAADGVRCGQPELPRRRKRGSVESRKSGSGGTQQDSAAGRAGRTDGLHQEAAAQPTGCRSLRGSLRGSWSAAPVTRSDHDATGDGSTDHAAQCELPCRAVRNPCVGDSRSGPGGVVAGSPPRATHSA